MGLKEFKEKNVVNYDSLLKEYKRTKEVIRDKLKDLKKVSFKEFEIGRASCRERV